MTHLVTKLTKTVTKTSDFLVQDLNIVKFSLISVLIYMLKEKTVTSFLNIVQLQLVFGVTLRGEQLKTTFTKNTVGGHH